MGLVQRSVDRPAPPAALSRSLKAAALWLAIWLLPLGLLILAAPARLAEIGIFFSKLAVLTFGGAYAVLAWMAQDVVQAKGWLTLKQMIDGLEGLSYSRFMLHYNFPPYSVGEVGRVGSPGRREIGHGKLAWRALQAVLPAPTDFPYTIRVVSEITESNGSSSMASVCGGSLSMMDAGVPLKSPVAGIAMGLVKEGDNFVVLSDILGDEDHLGDMDFKVAGTAKGVTSLQMDIKITGITEEIMRVALDQAKDGRLHILGEMSKAITRPRAELGEFARTHARYFELGRTGGHAIGGACQRLDRLDDEPREREVREHQQGDGEDRRIEREETRELRPDSLVEGHPNDHGVLDARHDHVQRTAA